MRSMGGVEAVLPCPQRMWSELLDQCWLWEVRYWYRGSRTCRHLLDMCMAPQIGSSRPHGQILLKYSKMAA